VTSKGLITWVKSLGAVAGQLVKALLVSGFYSKIWAQHPVGMIPLFCAMTFSKWLYITPISGADS